MATIKNGHTLTIGSNNYGIRAVEYLPLDRIGASFSHLCSQSCSIQKSTVSATGSRSLTDVISSASCMRLMPLDERTANQFSEIASPHKLRETFVKTSNTNEVVHLIIVVEGDS